MIRCIRNSRLLINTVCWIAIGLTVLESVYNVYLAFSEYNNDVNAFTEYSLDAENVVDQLNADSGNTFYRYENNYNYLYGLSIIVRHMTLMLTGSLQIWDIRTSLAKNISCVKHTGIVRCCLLIHCCL